MYIVDDSSSMGLVEKQSGIVPWTHTREALTTFAKICEEWDTDGQDLWFLNQEQPFLNACPQAIEAAFNRITPHGVTDMACTLVRVVSQYFERYTPESKPLNILAITDGRFTDDVLSAIRWINDELERRRAPLNQIGIQFVQVGANRKASDFLGALDNDIRKLRLARDIVDTVPWSRSSGPFNEMYFVKAICGAINKRWDAQSVTDTTKKRHRHRRIGSRQNFISFGL